MTVRKYSSRSLQTTLASSITNSATSATVVSGTNIMGGITVSAGQTFTVVIDPDTSLEEIVDVTAVSSNVLTITRAIDGSSGQAHSAGAVVRHMMIGRDLREVNDHTEASTSVHGITGSVVGTSDTQTLTNKTLTNPKVNAETNAQTTTAYTLVLTDASKLVTLSNAATSTVTIPPNTSVAFPTGAVVYFERKGAGAVVFAAGSGVTITSSGATTAAPTLYARYSGCFAFQTDTDTWWIAGDIA